MKFWKRNAVIATMLLFLCVAIYLNWSYNKGSDYSAAEEDSSKTLGEEVLVNSEEGKDSAVNSSGNDYFATARLTRKESRDSALALLKEAAGVAGVSADVKGEKADAIETMAQMTVEEGQIEGLIIAKGFKDCVAFINDNSIKLAVAAPKEGLTPSDIAKITDIVTSETTYTAGQINIIEVK